MNRLIILIKLFFFYFFSIILKLSTFTRIKDIYHLDLKNIIEMNIIRFI